MPDCAAALILLAIEDITDRRRLADALKVSEARYRRLFETAQDGILILNADTRLVFDANPFLTDLLGYGRDELVGKELWQIGLFKDIEANKTVFRELQARGYIRYEDLPLRTKDGRNIEVEFVSNVYMVGDSRVIQCNIRDVTDRKQPEHNLQSAHNLLEARVIERTADLARVNVALEGQINRSERAETSRRDLQGRLATAQEDERRRIARELHDQMGQYLTALGLGLKTIEDTAEWFPETVGQAAAAPAAHRSDWPRGPRPGTRDPADGPRRLRPADGHGDICRRVGGAIRSSGRLPLDRARWRTPSRHD